MRNTNMQEFPVHSNQIKTARCTGTETNLPPLLLTQRCHLLHHIFGSFVFDSIHAYFVFLSNHCSGPVMMSRRPHCEGLLIEAVSVSIQVSSLVPISVNLDSKDARTHTRTKTISHV